MYRKYIISEFTGISGEGYLIEIYKKGYSGNFKNIKGGANPVIHSYSTDDPYSPVKGSSLKVSLIGEGNLSISEFAGASDTDFMVKFYWNDQLRFIGYQVLEDFSDEAVDFNHELVLAFTDNLGILKDVSLLDAARRFGTSTVYTSSLNLIGRAADYRFQIQKSLADFPVAVGDTIVVEITEPEGAPYNGTYLVTGFSEAPSGTVTIVEVATFISLPLAIYLDFPGTVTLIKPYDLAAYSKLGKILRLCLLATDLQLDTYIFSNIKETTCSTLRVLDEIYLRGDSFQQNDQWKNCYDVLTIIMDRLKCTLMQINGVWKILRVPELRYYDNDIPGFRYNSEMIYQAADVSFDEVFEAGRTQDGFVTYAESAPVVTVQSPLKFVREKYRYLEPTDWLKNYKLDKLGKLIREYTYAGDLLKEYEMLYWTTGDSFPHPEFYIRVILDPSTLIEKSRYMVIEPSIVATAEGAKSNPIEIKQGDSFSLKFYYFISPYLYNNPYTTGFKIRLTNGTDNYFLANNGSWQTSGVYSNVQTTVGSWLIFDASDIAPAPITGNIYIYLPNSVTSGLMSELWYKDFQYKPVYNVSTSTLIKGHEHTDYNSDQIKQSTEKDIYIDDAPRNDIMGALCTPSVTSLVRDLTVLWKRDHIVDEEVRLGKITTFEHLFWRRKARYKLESTWRGLIQQITVRSIYYDLITGTTGGVDAGTGLNTVDFPALVDIIQPGDIIDIYAGGFNDGSYTINTQLTSTSYTVLEAIPTLETADYTIAIRRPVFMHLSAGTIMRIDYFKGLSFMFGSMEIDYKNNAVRGMLWEMWENGELDRDLRQYYEFKYLYDTK